MKGERKERKQIRSVFFMSKEKELADGEI